MYKTPFNDYGFGDDKTLIYDNSVDQEEVQKAIDDAFAEKDQFMKSATYDKDSKKFTFEVGDSSVEVAAADMFDGVATSDDINQINTKNEEQDTALSEKANTSDVYTRAEIDEKLEEMDISDLATKEEVQAVDAKVDAIVIPDTSDMATQTWVNEQGFLKEHQSLDDYATKDEVSETVTTEVAKIVADAPEDFDTLKEIADYIASDKTKADQIETSISNLEENKVDWVESTPGRKHIVLKNHDSVLGTATDGTTYNVAMVSKWDVADFGTSNLHTNLNSKDGVVTINDNKQVATTDDLPNVSNLATKAEVEAVDAKVDAIDISDMATQTWVNEQGFLKEHQSLEEYATKAEVEAVETALNEEAQRATSKEGELEGKDTELQANIDAVDAKVDAIVIPPTNRAFHEDWPTNTTIDAFCGAVSDDPEAVVGESYLGELTCSGLPTGMGNGEVKVEVLGDAENKILLLTVTSTNLAPYHWELTYIDGDKYGWRAWVEDTSLAAVAKSGDYADLTNQPTIPSIEGLAVASDVTEEIAAAVAPLAVKSEVTEEINAVSSALADFEAQTDTAMATKANAEDVYTKTESDELFQESGDYVSVEDYNELLRKFA